MQLDEELGPTELVVPEDEYEGAPSSQCTPIPAEAARPAKLSIRTPMVLVPEMHLSALRDTPSRASVPPPALWPPTPIAGVPETNVHLPWPGDAVQEAQCPHVLPLTPPSQLGGVPEVHLSAWAPPAQPRLLQNEDLDIQVMGQAENASEEENDPQAATPACSSPPYSRITNPTPAPSFYAIPDHPVELHSNPSPSLSPRSRLIRESAHGNASPAGAAHGHSPLLPQGVPLALPQFVDNSSSRPSTAEGSISLNDAGAPAGGRDGPPSAGTRQRRPAAVSGGQSGGSASAGARTQRGRSSKRKSNDDLSHGGRSSKKTRSATRSVAAGTDAAVDAPVTRGSRSASQHSRSTRSDKSRSVRGTDVPENEAATKVTRGAGDDGGGSRSQPLAPVAELTVEALGAHDSRRWGPSGEGCTRWLETNGKDHEARDVGPEYDQDLWCGDDFGGADFDGDECASCISCTDTDSLICS